MKKLFIFISFFILLFGKAYSVRADEVLLPANDIIVTEDPRPVQLDDDILEDALQPALSVYASSDAPDWLSNTHMPTYEYLKQRGLTDYSKIYSKIYKVFYNYGTNSSAKVLKFTFKINSETVTQNFILVDISEQMKNVDLNSESLLFPDSGQARYMDIYNLAALLFYENPQFYYYGGYKQIFVSSRRICIGISLPDDIDANDIQAQNEIITQTVKDYDKAVEGLSTNYLIEKAVHDKIVLENNYAYNESGSPAKEHYAHSILGIVDPAYTGAVCEGYSKSMLFFLNRYHVPCHYVAGKTELGDHAWNAVMLDDGEYHCVDSTWDDGIMVSGSTRLHMLTYKYFNTPSSAFYSDDSRDNSHIVIADVLPELSENNNFYNTDYDTLGYSGMRYTVSANGDRIYPAPTVTYPAKFIAAADSDIDMSSSEYGGSFTATDKYNSIIASNAEHIALGNESGSWSLKKTVTNPFITASGNAEISLLANNSIRLSATVYIPSGTLYVYVDDRLFETKESNSVYSQLVNDIILPHGSHKVTFKFSNVSNARLYNITPKLLADIDENGEINILDAVAFAAMPDLESDSTDTTYLLFDLNADGIIDNGDAKTILKEIIQETTF